MARRIFNVSIMAYRYSSTNCDFVQNCKKIFGAGVNYNAALTHYNLKKPEKPIIFTKPATTLITEGESIILPHGFAVNEEVELAVIISRKGKRIPRESAMSYVAGYCLALDLTATSELGPARAAGLPWAMGKGFDTACPVSRFISRDELQDPGHTRLWLDINGERVQSGNTVDLIFDIPHLISYISQTITLEPYDIILTGTPPGQSQIKDGDTIDCGIGLNDTSTDLLTINFRVTSE